MDIYEALKARHSVRSYKDRKITGYVKEELESFIDECSEKSGIYIKLFADEPKAFGGIISRYGKFVNVKNYILIAGKRGERLDEMCGYYDEKIVLKAQTLGLNTCWVGLTYNKSAIPYKPKIGEKICCVIAIGYGVSEGVPHSQKNINDVSFAEGTPPQWFINGVKAALLAPTALNQQMFFFELIDENKVKATACRGFYTKIDLGIAKYHFELGAGKENFTWK